MATLPYVDYWTSEEKEIEISVDDYVYAAWHGLDSYLTAHFDPGPENFEDKRKLLPTAIEAILQRWNPHTRSLTIPFSILGAFSKCIPTGTPVSVSMKGDVTFTCPTAVREVLTYIYPSYMGVSLFEDIFRHSNLFNGFMDDNSDWRGVLMSTSAKVYDDLHQLWLRFKKAKSNAEKLDAAILTTAAMHCGGSFMDHIDVPRHIKHHFRTKQIIDIFSLDEIEEYIKPG